VVLVAALLLILVLPLCLGQQAMAQHPGVEADLLDKPQEGRQGERVQRRELRGGSPHKALGALDFLTAETAETVVWVTTAVEAAEAAEEQIEAVAVAVAVVLTLLRQAHPAQEELPLKAPQAPQANRLPAQQTSPRTQAGRCPS
jgi:anthranilate/para-aminobenzoate synthase component II